MYSSENSSSTTARFLSFMTSLMTRRSTALFFSADIHISLWGCLPVDRFVTVTMSANSVEVKTWS
jgi:hypothetical protein